MRFPGQEAKGPISATVIVDGRHLSDVIKLLSGHVDALSAGSASAVFVLRNPLEGSEEISPLDSGEFIPGASIEIALGYSARDIRVFQGKIVAQRLTYDSDSLGRLHVICEGALNGQDGGLKLTLADDLLTLDARRLAEGGSGRLRSVGVAEGLGSRLELDGIGERFRGPYRITGVRHEFRSGVWETDLTFELLY